jgi:SAM-dependent methyltransferase
VTGEATSRLFFEQMYRRNPDPWNFESSDYERRRYDAIWCAVNDRRYHRAFEPGCSIGLLTARLALLSDTIQAVDISPTAVRHARRHCRSLPNVEIACAAFPEFVPRGSFDLIVISEVGYYFDARQLEMLGNDLVKRMSRGGVLLVAHWTGISKDHRLSGENVHRIFTGLEGLTPVHGERHSEFLLDRLERP